MLGPRIEGLAKLRSRNWRLAALVLWAAILLVNLGAAFEFGRVLAAPLDPNICSDHAHSEAAPPADHHATGPHCPLCFVVSAGVLAPPAGGYLMVLRPATGWARVHANLLASPTSELSRKGPLPRAPPAFV